METMKPHTAHIRSCPIESLSEILGGKWKLVIVYQLLNHGTMRFGELYTAMHGVTQKMLTKQLRALEKDGILQRRVYPVVPPKVEYSLTPLGTSLKEIVMSMQQWSKLHISEK